MKNKRASEPRRFLPSTRDLSRSQRERLLSRLVIMSIGSVLLLLLALLSYGYWREVVHKGDEPVAMVNGQAITLNVYAKVRGYRAHQLDEAIHQAQSSLSWLEAQARSRPTATAEPAGAVGEGAASDEDPQAAAPDGDEALRVQMQQQLYQLQSQRASLDYQLLEEMIEAELIRQEAARRGIALTAEEVEAEIARQFGAPIPLVTEEEAEADAAVSGEAEMEPTPEVPGPIDRLRLHLARTNLLTVEEYLHWIVEPSLLEYKLRDVLAADVSSEAEQVRARHLLVSTKEEAMQARERIVGGEGFEHVAAEVTLDTGSKEKGGDLGWFTRGVMDPEFERAAFELQPGTVSEPVQTYYGFHLILVEEHAASRPLSEEQLQRARARVFQEWLREQMSFESDSVKRLITADKINWAQRRAVDLLKAADPQD